ncbi:MAG: cytochrome P450, partial [Paracoccus sp.]|nr:cytochrome P450 [Paracoccus sp. (in: a-proteobacteria)]
TFIPQGGGSHDTGHRCPGEWIAIELMKAFCDFLVGSITYDLPDQDLSIDLSSLPALPKSRVVISRIRRRTSLRHDRIEVPAD